MKSLHILLLAISVSLLMAVNTSCDDGTSTLGNSLITDCASVIIDSSYVVTGQSVRTPSVQSRTLNQLLGQVNVKEFGSLKSDYVAQFMSVMNLDTVGVSTEDIDSVKLVMFFTSGAIVGDSLTPMGLKVYPLTKQLPSPIYSDFDPTGYYDPSQCWTPHTHIYVANALYNDSIAKLGYRTISVHLPLDFGKKVFDRYLSDPATFASPTAFAQFFPGLYVETNFGSGRITKISETRINFYYSKHEKISDGNTLRDTIISASRTYMAITPEVISDNVMSLAVSPSIQNHISGGKTLLVSPLGYDIELSFPTQAIVDNYRSNASAMTVINDLEFTIPVSTIPNTYGILPPKNLLLILKNKQSEFFANNMMTDEKTSFVATFNSVTSEYKFSGMRDYIISMVGKKEITSDDTTFSLLPVDLVVEEANNGYGVSSYITAINPYVGVPAMCECHLDKAKIKFSYSAQTNR